jgi:desulfoferrodoxin (superoxide reductase-like protein)
MTEEKPSIMPYLDRLNLVEIEMGKGPAPNTGLHRYRWVRLRQTQQQRSRLPLAKRHHAAAGKETPADSKGARVESD